METEREEILYSAAYGLYERSDYQAAREVFLQLVLFNTFDERYWKGLASCHHMLRQYKEALQAWSVVCILCEKDPYPHFHAAECLLSLKENEDGKKALNCAEERLSEDQEELRHKIKLLRKAA